MGKAEPTPIESRIVGLLRKRVEQAVQDHGSDWAATKLNISVSGVEAVLWDRDWSVGMAVQLAGGLGVLNDEDVDRLEEPRVTA